MLVLHSSPQFPGATELASPSDRLSSRHSEVAHLARFVLSSISLVGVSVLPYPERQ
jgi:hypothetical protein